VAHERPPRHRAGTRELEIGDVLKRDGEEWRVLSIDGDGHLVVTRTR
jgi:hypothetical protein